MPPSNEEIVPVTEADAVHGILIPIERPSARESPKKPYIVASVTVVGASALAVTGVAMAVPNQVNTTLVTFIAGFTLTGLASILSYLKSQETHLSVNSRLDEMVRNAKMVARMQGLAEGKVKGAAAANTRTDTIRKKRSTSR